MSSSTSDLPPRSRCRLLGLAPDCDQSVPTPAPVQAEAHGGGRARVPDPPSTTSGSEDALARDDHAGRLRDVLVVVASCSGPCRSSSSPWCPRSGWFWCPRWVVRSTDRRSGRTVRRAPPALLERAAGVVDRLVGVGHRSAGTVSPPASTAVASSRLITVRAVTINTTDGPRSPKLVPRKAPASTPPLIDDSEDCKPSAHYDGEYARAEDGCVRHGVGTRVVLAPLDEFPTVTLAVPPPVLQAHGCSVARTTQGST